MNILDKSVNAVRIGGIGGFLRNAWDSGTSQIALLYEAAILTAAWKSMVRAFESESEHVSGIAPLIAFAFRFRYMGVSVVPVQQKQEITELLTMLKRHGVKAALEIGTDKGGTLFLFSRIASPDATIVSMNLPWSSLNAYCMKYRNLLYRKFALPKQDLHLLTVNSHEGSSREHVKSLINGKKLDFLFIDGDHSYEGVKKDFEMYAPLVRKGGLIGFHDIAVNSTQKANPVRDYWMEVRKVHEHKELEYSGGKGYGIGIVYWKGRGSA